MRSGSIAAARWLGAGGLLAIAAVHVGWARGAAWPAPDRKRLADAVIGWDELPTGAPCLAIAALLTTGAGFVAGFPRQTPRLQRLGAAGVVVTLATRGIIGFSHLVTAERFSPAFVRWNRRLYSPLCLALAALCAAGIAPLPHPDTIHRDVELV